MKTRMGLLISLITIIFSLPTNANQNSFLVKYFDCASSTNFISDNLPIFIKVNGQKLKTTYKAGAYTRGINITVNSSPNGVIKAIGLGEKISLSPKEFEAGIEFGVTNLTAHTIQLIDFNSQDGGILEFGFLKKFSAKKSFQVESTTILGQKYRSIYGENWGTYRLRLTKNNETRKWEVIDANANNVSAIFGIMVIKNNLFVFGISDMTVTNEPLDFSGKTITISKNQKIFECEI